MEWDTWAREKDNHLPRIFKERMLWEFGCNKPEWRIHFIVYLLEYRNHIAFVGFHVLWGFLFVWLACCWFLCLFVLKIIFGRAFCLCVYVWFLFCLKNNSWELVRQNKTVNLGLISLIMQMHATC